MSRPERLDGLADSKTRLSLWLSILKVSHLVEGELRECLRTEFDTTLPRFDVLAALHRASAGLRMSALSSVLRVSNGNVTGIVDRLVADGLVERVPVAGDRRVKMVRITRRGADDLAALATAHEAWVSELLGALSAAEAAKLVQLLQAVGDSLDLRRDAGA